MHLKAEIGESFVNPVQELVTRYKSQSQDALVRYKLIVCHIKTLKIYPELIQNPKSTRDK
jgi:hypothetical protein